MKEGNLTEPIGQNIIKFISNLCFSVFVFSVLILTVIAITYQPPDPWLETSKALTRVFTDVENATFKTDTSISITGEDLDPATNTVPAAMPSITEATIEKSEEKMANFSSDPKTQL